METTADASIRAAEVDHGPKAEEASTSKIEAKDHRASCAKDTSSSCRCSRTQAEGHAEASRLQGDAKRRQTLQEKGAEEGATRQVERFRGERLRGEVDEAAAAADDLRP